MADQRLASAALPFALRLADGRLLQCAKCLRERPGKRLACMARLDGRTVFAKLFAATPSGRRHWRSERDNLAALRRHGVPAPSLLEAGESDGVLLLVSTYLEGAETLSAYFQRTTDPERYRQVVHQLFALIGRLHRARMLHADPHLGNFMRMGGTLYCVDAGDLRTQRRLGRAAARDNLALAAAQLPPIDPALIADALAAYHVAGGARLQETALQAAVAAQRERRWRKFAAKIYRNCTAYAVYASARRRLVCRRADYRGELRAFLADPDAFLDRGGFERVKDGNSSTVFRGTLDGVTRVIKRYNIKSRTHALTRALQPTRAARSWRNAHLLRFHGIPTAAPVAFAERRLGPLRSTAWLVLEYLEGPTLRDALSADGVLDEGLAMQTVVLLQRLRDLRIAHGDLKASNFIVTPGGLALIDLDALVRCSGRTCARLLARDTQRFLRNWHDQPEVLEWFEQRMRGQFT